MAPTNCHAESRGSCVSVSRVMTYFTFGQNRQFHRRRARSDPLAQLRPGAQKPIQFRKLSSLALVTHPDPLCGIPSARAMEEEENVVFPNPCTFH